MVDQDLHIDLDFRSSYMECQSIERPDSLGLDQEISSRSRSSQDLDLDTFCFDEDRGDIPSRIYF